MKLDITRFSSVRLSQDDEQYQKNLTALKEAGFCLTQSNKNGLNLNLSSKEKR